MSKYTVIAREEGQWIRVRYAPVFDTEIEAQDWMDTIGNNGGWDCPVEVIEIEEEND